MKIPAPSKRFWITITTLLVIGAFFAYYLFVYVHNREVKLRKEKYRALERYGQNIIHAKNDYAVTIGRVWEKIKKGAHRDSIEKNLRELNVHYLGYLTDSRRDHEIHNDFSAVFFSYPSENKEQKYTIRVETRHPSRTERHGLFRISIAELVKKHVPFDEFFIVRSYDEKMHNEVHQKHRSSHENDKPLMAGVVYQTFKNKINLDSLKGFLSIDHGLVTSRFHDITLVDTPYKIFIQTTRFGRGEDWILCGLIEVENYNNQIRKVDPLMLTSAILIVLFLLIAMPLLKVFVMNAFERFTAVNVFLIGFSIVFGTALIYLTIAGMSDYLQSKEKVDKELKLLSGNVKSNVQAELNSIYSQLSYLQEKKPNIPSQSKYAKSKKEKIVYGKVLENPLDFQFKSYSTFNEVIWIDKKGKPTLMLATHEMDPSDHLPNLSERKYFSRVMNDTLWVVPGDATGEKKFALQSIFSWRSHTPEAGMGIKIKSNGDATVLAMATRLHSVMDPLLPPGYGFCIVDDSGEVWFHSDTKKNLQENFFEEVHKNSKLAAALKGRIETHFSSVYNGCRHRMFVQPIDDIPLHLITFHNNDYVKTPVILTILFTFGFLIILFVIQGAQLSLLFICTNKPGKLALKTFFLKWIQPVIPENGNEPLNNNILLRYVRSIFVQATLLFILLVFLFFNNTAVTLTLVTLPVFILCLHYGLFNFDKEASKRSVYLFCGLSALLVIALNIYALRYVKTAEAVVIQLIYLAVITIAIFKPTEQLTKMINPFIGKVNVRHVYPLFLMLWLALVTVIPVIFFYNAAHQTQNEIWSKYIGLEAAENNFKRVKQFDDKLKIFKDDTRAKIDSWGNYLTSTDVFKRDASGSTNSSTATSKLDSLLFESWPRFAGLFNLASATIFNKASDGKWESVEKKKEEVRLTYKNDPREAISTGDFENRIAYWVKVPTFKLFGGDYGPLMFLLAILIVPFLLARSILFSIRYVFGIGLIPIAIYPLTIKSKDFKKEPIQEEDLTSQKTSFAETQSIRQSAMQKVVEVSSLSHIAQSGTLTQPEVENGSEVSLQTERPTSTLRPDTDERNAAMVKGERIFFVGLPYCQPHEFIKESEKMSDTCVVDLRADQYQWNGQNKTILKHFEYGLNDHETNQRKLELIKGILTKRNDCELIIASTGQPSVIIDVYKSKINNLEMKPANEVVGESIRKFKIAIRNWKNILSTFVTQYQTINPNQVDRRNKMNDGEAELSASQYLVTLKKYFSENELASDADDLVMRIEEMAEPYYHALWNSFTASEKFLLYDLANDGFVNLKNLKTIRVLMQKGVIINNEGLSIINRSFANFILTTFKDDEELRMENELHKRGSWHTFRLVLIIVLLSITAFIALAQQELLSDLNALLAALGSAILFLTRIGGIFSPGLKAKGE